MKTKREGFWLENERKELRRICFFLLHLITVTVHLGKKAVQKKFFHFKGRSERNKPNLVSWPNHYGNLWALLSKSILEIFKNLWKARENLQFGTQFFTPRAKPNQNSLLFRNKRLLLCTIDCYRPMDKASARASAIWKVLYSKIKHPFLHFNLFDNKI